MRIVNGSQRFLRPCAIDVEALNDDALFPLATDDVIDGSLAMFPMVWETIIGAKVAARLLNIPAGELLGFDGRNPPAVRRKFSH
jgi:hypothetical protein